MKRFVFGLLISAALAPSSGQAQALRPCPTAVVPQKVGELELFAWERFSERSAGEVFRFRHLGSWGADVFVYPADTVFSKEHEAGLFKDAMNRYQQRGDFDSMAVVREGGFETGFNSGLELVAEVHKGTRTSRTFLYVVPINDTLVKVRATFLKGRVEDEVVAGFIRQLVAAIGAGGSAN